MSDESMGESYTGTTNSKDMKAALRALVDRERASPHLPKFVIRDVEHLAAAYGLD